EPGGLERHARRLTHGAFGGLDRIRVAERDGAIVAHAALYPLEVWLGGKKVPVGGIGSLAVAPDARRTGVAGALLDALHAEVVAFAAFSYDGHAMSSDQTLVVHELTAKDGDARRALLGSLAAQRDQVADIELTVAYGDPLALAFEDGAGPRRAGDLHAHLLG